MKGIVIAPTFYKNNAPKSKAMYDKLCEKYNFSYLCTDTPNLDGYDVAIIQSVPYHNRPGVPTGLLDAKCKLIGEFGDLQCWDNKECIKNKEILFDRYDVLVGTYYEKFREWYPQHVHKYVHWPQYFGPYTRYASLSINPNSKMRCLMIGSYNDPYYRRRYVINNRGRFVDGGCIDVVGPTVPFDKYPKYLNEYFCSLALPGKFNLPISKYFEIPAAGVLLLATETKEASICGFEPYVNYVPVTRKNVFGVVKGVLDHTADYIKIRDEGTRFVRENHSDINRINKFEEIFNRLWSDGHKSLLR
jgi:hypothetical protein